MQTPVTKKFNFKFGKQTSPESPVFYLLTGSGASSANDADAASSGIKQLTFGKSGKRTSFAVTLVPMRSVSQDVFSFPFSSTVKVRTALRLRVMPWSAAGDFEIFPVVTSHEGRGVSGVAWYVSPSEFDKFDSGGAKGLVWPAPLPLVSKVDGTGVTMFADSENLCSILWQNDLPVLSRWRPRSSANSGTGSTPESELEWFDKYCASQTLNRGESFVMDVSKGTQACDDLEEIAKASLARCPWLTSVNLSRMALEGARDLERSVSLMTKAACWLFLMGALVLGGNILRWKDAENTVEAVRLQNEKLYRDTFEPTRTGRIGNPVTLARDRIAAIQGAQSTGRSLGSVLTDLGSVFTENPSTDIAIDILRYNADGMDCTGLAPDMTTVLSFRKAWEERAALSQLDNTQNVSNAGYRFDLRVRWQGNR